MEAEGGVAMGVVVSVDSAASSPEPPLIADGPVVGAYAGASEGASEGDAASGERSSPHGSCTTRCRGTAAASRRAS